MSKQKKYAELSATDALKKHSELSKELAKFRLSLDPAVITSSNGLVGLRRDLKILARKAASGQTAAK